MASGQGGNKLNFSNSRNLSEDESEKQEYNLLQRNATAAVPTKRQPAQGRLKRLQSNLKRLHKKEPPVVDIKKAVANRMTRRFSMFSRESTSPPNLNARRWSTCSDTPPSPQKAWEKPKALLDASNRLEVRTSQSANQRLMQLQASLRQQQQAKESNNNNKSTAFLQETLTQTPKGTNISAFHTSTTTSKEDPDESMDWEDSVEEKQVERDEKVEISEILFMRQASDEDELPTRLLDHTYFVLDTNILMDNIRFVEYITEVVLPGTIGSMLYIPYVVIKELDKLKSSSANKRDQLARKAIRYLNTKFDESLQIQAQSALEETERLIDVDCPDDSIVNCCLQLKEQVTNMMLLTNDNNLRLKANASDIPVACRSDLLADYPEEFAALSD